MSVITHTPLPWKRERGRVVAMKQPGPLCKTARWVTVASLSVAYKGSSEADANAALIVRAVNAHDALVAALKRIVADWESVPENVQVPDQINVDAHWDAAREALALAAGTPGAGG